VELLLVQSSGAVKSVIVEVFCDNAFEGCFKDLAAFGDRNQLRGGTAESTDLGNSFHLAISHVSLTP
ncbi:MAG: hypothetical protein KDB01_22380, partial [Planctomycetaceae bacterium]|nr:hypothetical protein [Planctomycetaceae bacterium]